MITYMVTYYVSCFRDDHYEGVFPVREGNYKSRSLDEATEVANARVKSDHYDRVEVMAMGEPCEIPNPFPFQWERDKAAQA
jgi:hypothetical protein